MRELIRDEIAHISGGVVLSNWHLILLGGIGGGILGAHLGVLGGYLAGPTLVPTSAFYMYSSIPSVTRGHLIGVAAGALIAGLTVGALIRYYPSQVDNIRSWG